MYMLGGITKQFNKGSMKMNFIHKRKVDIKQIITARLFAADKKKISIEEEDEVVVIETEFGTLEITANNFELSLTWIET